MCRLDAMQGYAQSDLSSSAEMVRSLPGAAVLPVTAEVATSTSWPIFVRCADQKRISEGSTTMRMTRGSLAEPGWRSVEALDQTIAPAAEQQGA